MQKSTVITMFALLVVLGLVAGGVVMANRNKTDQAASPPPGQTTSPSTPNQEEQPMDARKLENFKPLDKVTELQKVDIKEGSGEVVPEGATVSAHYTGALAKDGVVFESSKDFGTEPIEFGLGQVIAGWTQGVPGMKVGGTRRLVIPASLAYGANPPSGSGIPANADLVFDIEIIAIK